MIRASLRRLLHGITSRIKSKIALGNAPETGVHLGGKITRKTDAAITTRYLIGKVGSDANHVAVCGAADVPLCVIMDEASAAQDLVNCLLLGSAESTVKVVTDGSGAIVAGDLLIPAANGKVKKFAGNGVYVIGAALESPVTADGEQFEMDPRFYVFQ